MIDCESLSKLSRELSLVADCGLINPNLLRVTTIFKYPDGSHIDLFLREHETLFREFTLSDLGETAGYLLELNIRPWKTNKRKDLVSRICKTLGVKQEGAELRIDISEHELSSSLADALVRLSQACIRVSDLALSFTIRTVSAFRDDIEEFLESTGYKYETDVAVPGLFGKEVKIDFQVEGPKRKSLILALTAANTFTAARISHDVYIKWSDIRHVKSAQQFLTAFDSDTSVLAGTDLQRIEEFSMVVGFPADQSVLRDLLEAA